MSGYRNIVGLSVVALLALTLGLTGCASSGSQLGKGHNAAQGLFESSDLIRKGRDQVQATMDSLTALRDLSGGSLSDLYGAFTNNMSNLESIAGRIGATNNEMRAQGEKYFATWDEQIAQISNEDIQKRTTERREQVQKSLEKVAARFDKLAAAYDTFITDLSDLQTALQADLTQDGVKAMGKPIGQALDHGGSVMKAAEEVAQAYEELGIRLSTEAR